MIPRLIALLTAAALVAFCLAQTVQSKTVLPPWVTRHPVTDCSQGCWRIESIDYRDASTSGNLHHIFAKAKNANGQYIVTTWQVDTATQTYTLQTKPPPDWGDFPMFECFSPSEGEVGGYSVWMGTDRDKSEWLSGLGLPECQHETVYVTWRRDNGGTATPTPTPAHRLWLPIISKS